MASPPKAPPSSSHSYVPLESVPWSWRYGVQVQSYCTCRFYWPSDVWLVYNWCYSLLQRSSRRRTYEHSIGVGRRTCRCLSWAVNGSCGSTCAYNSITRPIANTNQAPWTSSSWGKTSSLLYSITLCFFGSLRFELNLRLFSTPPYIWNTLLRWMASW